VRSAECSSDSLLLAFARAIMPSLFRSFEIIVQKTKTWTVVKLREEQILNMFVIVELESY
jgi:hypothetical protein